MGDKLGYEQKEGRHDVHHAFHSGWGATSDEALKNADALRGHMADRGLHTQDKDWSVFSDPREWQVLREKNVPPGKPPSIEKAARLMVDHTMDYHPTMWHGHSQGGAQITAAAEEAERMLAAEDKIRTKAEKRARKDSGDKYDGKDVPEKVIDEIAHEKAKHRLAKYNEFSYSGAAMFPPSFATDATHTHKEGDPVSGWAVNLGLKPLLKLREGKEGEHREKVVLDGGDERKWLHHRFFQGDIKNHFYNQNYAENDAAVTEKMLRQTGRLKAGPALDGQTVGPLPDTTPGNRVGDGKSLGPLAEKTWGGMKRAGSAAMAPAHWAADAADWGEETANSSYDATKRGVKAGFGKAKELGSSAWDKTKGLFGHWAD